MSEPLTGPIGTAAPAAVPAEHPTTIAAYLCHLPGVGHPWWTHYLLSLIHLRDVRGTPPATKRSPEMTHELIVAALDPDAHPRARDPATWRLATEDVFRRMIERSRAPGNELVVTIVNWSPIRVSEQFHVGTDDQARAVLELVARALVDGFLPAEPSDHEGARERWRSSITQTAEHFREGRR